MNNHIVSAFFILCLILSISACRTVPSNPGNKDTTTNGGGGLTSAIDGIVLKGPITPVSKLGVPNVAPLAGAPVTITSNVTNTILATLMSDSAGRFSISVAAGSYTLTPVQISNNTFPRPPQPQTIQVPANTIVYDTLNYDTGIR